jgi:hypothetical protein
MSTYQRNKHVHPNASIGKNVGENSRNNDRISVIDFSDNEKIQICIILHIYPKYDTIKSSISYL